MQFYQDERLTSLTGPDYEFLMPTQSWPGFLENMKKFMPADESGPKLSKAASEKLRAELDDTKSQVEFLHSELDGLQDTYDKLLVNYNGLLTQVLPKANPDVSSDTITDAPVLGTDDTASDVSVLAGEPPVQEVMTATEVYKRYAEGIDNMIPPSTLTFNRKGNNMPDGVPDGSK
jgi:hypothetical protein